MVRRRALARRRCSASVAAWLILDLLSSAVSTVAQLSRNHPNGYTFALFSGPPFAGDLPNLAVDSEFQDYRDLPAPFRESHRALETRSGITDILWFGNPAAAIRREVAPQSGEPVIRKRSFGALNSTDLDGVLRH